MIKPADAQNIAQTKYPDGTILTAEITRRGKDLVYVYMIQPKGEHRPREILVSAMDGTILKTKAIGEKQDTTEKKDTTRIHKGQVTGDE